MQHNPKPRAGTKPPPKPTQALRDQLEAALRANDVAAALQACAELERAEPREPRWPHRHGDLARRAGRRAQALAAYERTATLYMELGFHARAAAMARVVLDLDPHSTLATRLEAKVPAGTGVTRETQRAPSSDTSASIPAVPPPPAVPRASSPPPPPASGISPPHGVARTTATLPRVTLPAREPAADDFWEVERGRTSPPSRPSSPPPPPPLGFSAATRQTMIPPAARTPADSRAMVLDMSELDSGVQARAATGGDDDLALDQLFVPRALEGIPQVTLLGDVPRIALTELGRTCRVLELVDGEPILREGEAADALYAIVQGTVVATTRTGRELVMTEGDVFGEACFLADAKRTVQARTRGRALVVEIPRRAFERFALEYPRVESTLLELLTRRVVGALFVESDDFAALGHDVRKRAARLFEVRRVQHGGCICVAGKRADALYVVLAGRVEVTRPDGAGRIVSAGTVVGRRSWLEGSQLEVLTVVSVGTSFVLRLPSEAFAPLVAADPTSWHALLERDSFAHTDDVVPELLF